MLSCYIAMSIDGMIATDNGPESVSWLDPYNEVITAHPNGYFAKRYDEYLADIKTVVIGANTYNVIRDFTGDYMYKEQNNIVITRNTNQIDENIDRFMTLDEFKQTQFEGKTWIVGGGEIVSQLLDANLLDEIIITLMPVVLGDGIRLFTNHNTIHFDCTNIVEENGLVELTYIRKK